MKNSTPASKAKKTKLDEKDESDLYEQARALRNLASKLLTREELPVTKHTHKIKKKETILRKWVKRIFPVTILLIVLSGQVILKIGNDINSVDKPLIHCTR